jgi:hypothetical protein
MVNQGDGEPTSNKQSSVLRLRQCGIQLVCDHCDPSLQGSKEDQVDDKSLCNGKLKFFKVHNLSSMGSSSSVAQFIILGTKQNIHFLTYFRGKNMNWSCTKILNADIITYVNGIPDQY